MYKCTVEKGQMIFTDETGKTYKPGGKTYENVNEITTEYKLVKKILSDHAWAHPVVEQLNRRADILKENLMNIMGNR